MWKHFVGVALANLVACTAAAAPVQVVFSGTVSAITHDPLLAYSLDPSVMVGTRLSGSWTYDDAAPRVDFSPEHVDSEGGPAPEFSQYDLTAAGTPSFQVGSYSIGGAPTSFLLDVSDYEQFPGGSSLQVSWQTPVSGMAPLSFIGGQFVLSSTGTGDGGPLHGTALPGLPFSLTDFPQTSVDLFFVDSHGYAINLYGALDALAVVPEPSRLVLCVLAAAALALQRQ